MIQALPRTDHPFEEIVKKLWTMWKTQQPYEKRLWITLKSSWNALWTSASISFMSRWINPQV